MAKYATITLEQLRQVKKKLQDLPEKEDRKTRQEAAKLLENDFRKAFKKGYTPEEIRAILKTENITIPAYLIRQFLSENADKNHSEIAQQEMEQAEKIIEKIEPVPGNSFIVPDTPDEEL